MSDRPKKRRAKRLGVVLASAVAAVAVSGVTAGAANAQVSFPNSALDLGPLVKNQDITPGDNNLVVTPAFVGVGEIEVTPANFDFDAATMSIAGNPLTLDLTLTETATGDFDPATGVLSMDPDTTIQASISGACAITTEMPFSTSATQTRADNDAFLGAPILLAAIPVSGAIATNWATLPDPTDIVPQCSQPDPEDGSIPSETIKSITKGPGGIWFGTEGTPTPSKQVKPVKPIDNTEARNACIAAANKAFKKKVKKAKTKKAKKALVLKKKKAIKACGVKFP